MSRSETPKERERREDAEAMAEIKKEIDTFDAQHPGPRDATEDFVGLVNAWFPGRR